MNIIGLTFQSHQKREYEISEIDRFNDLLYYIGGNREVDKEVNGKWTIATIRMDEWNDIILKIEQ